MVRGCGGQPLRGRRSEISLSAHCRGRPPCLPVFRWLVCGLGTGGQTRESAPTCGCRGFGLGLWAGALGWGSCSGGKSILAPPHLRTTVPPRNAIQISTPFGRLGSSEQPPMWLRPHQGERIPHSRRRAGWGWVFLLSRLQSYDAKPTQKNATTRKLHFVYTI